MADNFGLKIGLEGEKEFKKAIADINQSFKVLGSEMKLVSSDFGKNDTSMQAVAARSEVLNKQIDAQKQKIEETAQGILDARALYPDSSLADLYDPLTMPPELRKAHTKNDIAVMQAYGFSTKMSEADCVAALMKMYQELVKKLEL